MTRRLLLVLPGPARAQRFREAVEAAGYEVAVAPDGEQALAWLARHGSPDVVVSDVSLPGMSGYELCQRIGSDRPLTQVPVLLLTSRREPLDVVQGVTCGADDVLVAPVDPRELLERLAAAGRRGTGADVGGLLRRHPATVDADREQLVDALAWSLEQHRRTEERLRVRERELQQARDELRQTLGHAGVVRWKLRLPEGVIEWSDNARELFGLPADFPIDQLGRWLDRVHPDDRPFLAELAEERVCSPGARIADEWEYRLVGDDGDCRWFTARGQVVDRQGDGATIIGVAIDTTPRRRLEEDLRLRERTLSAVLAASPDAILVTGTHGRISFASERVQDIIGVEADAMIGRSPREFLADDQEEARYRGAGSVRIRDGAATDRLRLAVRHADGHEVTVDARIGEVTDARGGTDGYVAVLRDVTDQARLETALERAKEEADRANQAKSEYLSRMSHELRTPMNTVLGFSQLLQLSDLAPEDRDAVDRILRAGRHLVQLIDDVLDIARIEAGSVDVSSEPVAVGPVARAAADLLEHQAQERDVSIQLADDHGGWPHVLADQQRLAQVLINLLSNAVKYNRPGGEIRVHCRAVGDGWHRIDVADTGPGIAPEQLARVFTPFDRLGADRSQVSGTGLGLALSRGLIDMMGGRIGCDSTPGVGSTFWVELPAAPAPAPDDGADPALVADDGHAPVGTLLYVEDNPMNLELVRRAFASAPELELLHAETGEDGVALARERCPDLILLDLHLAGRSGREVLAELRADPRTRPLPVVIVSADATTTTTDELLDAGADDFVTKPFDLVELRGLVAGFLDERDDGTEEVR